MCVAGENFITMGEAAAALETTETRILMMLKNRNWQGNRLMTSGTLTRHRCNCAASRSLLISEKPVAAAAVAVAAAADTDRQE